MWGRQVIQFNLQGNMFKNACMDTQTLLSFRLTPISLNSPSPFYFPRSSRGFDLWHSVSFYLPTYWGHPFTTPPIQYLAFYNFFIFSKAAICNPFCAGNRDVNRKAQRTQDLLEASVLTSNMAGIVKSQNAEVKMFQTVASTYGGSNTFFKYYMLLPVKD